MNHFGGAGQPTDFKVSDSTSGEDTYGEGAGGRRRREREGRGAAGGRGRGQGEGQWGRVLLGGAAHVPEDGGGPTDCREMAVRWCRLLWAVMLCRLHGENGATEAFKFQSRAPTNPPYRGRFSAELVRSRPARRTAPHTCVRPPLVHSQTPEPKQRLVVPLVILVVGCLGNANAERPVTPATQHKHTR